jgi:UDP-MurNAc hydroxylase
MRFQVLSHAGLSVRNSDTTLVCDPWILGSCYWRSWWNYPPVSDELVNSLKADYIYLTHIHWDHFQGASLRKFAKSTPIAVPKGNYSRIARDLNRMGFKNVIELRHGQSLNLARDFRITSYQFGVFLDSALVIECEGVTLFNANDAKFMGLPLKQILTRHPKIDFVLRSHSSANSRLSYQIIDDPDARVDDIARYIRDFASFAKLTRAKYAIPFASNHCYLHKDVFELNGTVQTPQMVEQYFRDNNIQTPTVKVMVSGDSWSSEGGFDTSQSDYFSERDYHLEVYRDQNREKLEAFYEREEKAVVKASDMVKYFDEFFMAIPRVIRSRFKNHPITYALKAGDRQSIFRVDIWKRSVEELTRCNDQELPIQIHTSAFIMLHCMRMDLFSHLAISKRVVYRVTAANRKYVQLLNLLFNLYEYDWLPLRRVVRYRVFETYFLRWREILLYAQIAMDALLRRKFDSSRYLKPNQASQAMQ